MSSIKIFEPETDEILTRADVANMRLPFEHGWVTYLVCDDLGNIVGTRDNYVDAENYREAIQPLVA